MVYRIIEKLRDPLNRSKNRWMDVLVYSDQGFGSGLIMTGSGFGSNIPGQAESGSMIFSRPDPNPGKNGSGHVCLKNFTSIL